MMTGRVDWRVRGYGGRGDFLVMRAQATPGHEFAPRIP